MGNNLVNLIIADDHQIIIDGLHSLLKAHPHLRIVAETTEPGEILKLLSSYQTDILLTDLMMPGMNGRDLARMVKHKFPKVKILVLSMSGEGDLVNDMINEADISGYVLKNVGQEELIKAIAKIASGGIYFSEEVIEEMTRASERKKKLDEIHLTDREVEIIRLIEKEKSNKEIAGSLFISERTVETHRKNIFRKTRTGSVIGLVKYAYEHRLV